MCGICGYVGHNEAAPIIVNGLRRVEYRGYDSVGEATVFNNKLLVKKDIGKIDEVDERIKLYDLPGNIGIGHTRWATAGAVTQKNAHPHTDCNNSIAIIHNGILDSYPRIKEELISRGHKFSSQTDTEIFTHLVEEAFETHKDFGTAFYESVKKLQPNDQYAFVGIHKDENTILAARNKAPLCIGLGQNEKFIASDPLAFLEHTNQVMYLEDGDVVKIDGEVKFLNDGGLVRKVETHPWTLESLDKNIYKFYTLKEIAEIPVASKRVLNAKREEEFEYFADLIDPAKKVILTGCGTSSYAADAYRKLTKNLLREENEVIVSNAFKDDAVINPGDVVIAISQSGTTFDVNEAVKYAKKEGARTLSIVNVPNSDLTRLTEKTLYTLAGTEKGVASTKNFINQLATFYQLAIYRAKRFGKDVAELEHGLNNISGKIYQAMTESEAHAVNLAKELKDAKLIAILGAGPTYSVAEEAALKWREMARKYAIGFPAGELKHGSLALIENGTVVFGNYNKDSSYDSIRTSSEEAVIRGAYHIAIQPSSLENIHHAKYTIRVPDVHPLLMPFVQVPVHYKLVAQTTLELGYDLDYLRNLAKSVTVK